MPIVDGKLCRHDLVPLGQVLGMKGFNAFGSSYKFGHEDGPDDMGMPGIEGPWVAPIFTAGILFIIAYLVYFAKVGNRPPTLLRKIIALYAFNTAVVEVCRFVFDVNRFALVWAALHNLAEWGIIGHLVVNEGLVGTFFKRSLLWIWLVSQVVLFAPFMAGALAEQVAGIWCDWLLVFLMTYHFLVRKDSTDPKVLAVYRWGFYGAIAHMLEILPLVSLLVGLVTLPSIAGSILIAVSEPLTFYFYYMFALEWDKSLLDQPLEAAPAAGDADAPAADVHASDAPNGRAHQATPYDQTGVYLTGDKPGQHGTELPLRVKVTIGVITILLGLLTVVVPVLVIPGCNATPPPNFMPMPSLFKGFGSAAPPTPVPSVVSVAPDAARPLCSAPQTVEGSTFVVARPGRARELATMLESHPMLARKAEGNLKYELSETTDNMFRIDERWSSKRTMFSWLTTPTPRSYLTPAFSELVLSVDVKGPFHPFIPCAAAAQQPREYLIREPVVVNAPLTCVWAQLNNFSDASTSVGNIAWRGNVDGNPDLRAVMEPFPKPPANCTMRQFRQTLPAVPQPPNGHQLIFHSLSGCWLDPAQSALVETQSTEIVVVPHAGGSPTTGSTHLAYTLRLSPKNSTVTEEMLAGFRAGNAVHVPALKELLERRCAGARIKALSAQLEAEARVFQ